MRPGIKDLVGKLLLWLPYMIIAAGILLRIVVFAHNRSMISDEANVARNIYERNYTSLLSPLDYGTFAPPAYLWILKFITGTWGFSEFALRIYPLLGSCISLYLLLLISGKLGAGKSVWYPLFLMASGYIYIRYATEAKQYATDTAVILALLMLTLKTDLGRTKPSVYMAIWSVAGCLAICLSMPAIFMLAGIGVYYFYHAFTAHKNKIILVTSTCVFWLVGFMLYYFMVLKNEVNSAYLQGWHSTYFLTFWPDTMEKAGHNLSITSDILREASGNTVLAIAFHLILLTTAIIFLARKNKSQLLLFLVPAICLLVAACMHKFTLLPRVSLFIMPLLLILTGIGLEQLWQLRYGILKFIVIIIAAICMVNFNHFEYLLNPLENEEFKQGLEIIKREGIDGKHLYINSLAVPVYKYYTQIHPGKDKWKEQAGADEMRYGTDYDSLAATMQGKNAMIYEGVSDYELDFEVKRDNIYFKSVNIKPFKGGSIYILTK